jgi:hypothetical protein
VQSSEVQNLRRNHLGRLRPARRPGPSRRTPGRPLPRTPIGSSEPQRLVRPLVRPVTNPREQGPVWVSRSYRLTKAALIWTNRGRRWVPPGRCPPEPPRRPMVPGTGAVLG